MSEAWIGIGANQESAVNMVMRALEAIGQAEGVTLSARSSLYRTAPQDYPDQADFINAVVRVKTTLRPLELLDTLQTLERELGRVREGPRFGPRRIDLDLLLYDNMQCHDERLELPHPRMHRRRFVLLPLVEINPQAWIPGQGYAEALLGACESQRVVRIDHANDQYDN